ncbi:uncharacterized protein DNG_06074 [Cephalotrichum gorgonifer]|uniref:Cyclin-dependent protein kinase regulator pho80 n=1 Tax=Cephalotrichum gorgonifer TaxID=2041049 RepID=A0AAE8SW36_9PEZI|nr:uncharacterized protein DNG_06074 [Cephalotrichum gorgonifer]
MRVTAIFAALLPAALVAADLAQVYIQPITPADSPSIPSLLAEVRYNPLDASNSDLISYEPPELPSDAQLVRVGLYDASVSTWSSSSVASVENFSRGYAPTILLTVDHKGRAVSASVKGVVIDAGQTRDFGPSVVVSVSGKGPQPELNKPVVLSPEGKKVEAEEEKTLLQKYWWVALALVILMASGGGDK